MTQGLLDRYQRARDYVDVELVRLEPRRRDPVGKVAAARAFMAELGEPHRAYPSIQVAGTSGKGSVAALIARALHLAGIRSGLHVTPYLQVFTEKTVIAERLLAADRFTEVVDELRPVADRYAADDDLPASVHGLASLASTYLAFAQDGVELAVVETGVGGRFDLVQGLRKELTVITELGLDHTKALGPTLDQIAHHKAGIMERGVPCVAVRGPGWQVLVDEAARVGAELIPVEPTPGRDFGHRNAAVARQALEVLSRRGWDVDPEHLARASISPALPGRREAIAPGVILDGAHNPQKLAALLETLDEAPRTIVLATSGSRTPEPLLRLLAPRARRLIACAPDLYGKQVVSPADLAQAARAAGIEAEAAPSPEEALAQAIAHEDPVLVTGSFYLVGRLRNRWIPWQDVLLQRSCWPAPLDGSAPPP